jgi:hypothetical protein
MRQKQGAENRKISLFLLHIKKILFFATDFNANETEFKQLVVANLTGENLEVR